MTKPIKPLAQALVDLREDIAAIQRFEQEGQEDWLIDAEDDLRADAEAVLAAIDSGDRVIDFQPARQSDGGAENAKRAA